jgi:hypothetical protein
MMVASAGCFPGCLRLSISFRHYKLNKWREPGSIQQSNISRRVCSLELTLRLPRNRTMAGGCGGESESPQMSRSAETLLTRERLAPLSVKLAFSLRHLFK